MVFETEFFLSLFPTIIKYSLVTLRISLIAFVLSLILAILISLISYMKISIISPLVDLWVAIFRGTPLVAQMFFIYFGLAQIIVFLREMSGEAVAIMVLSFNASAHMSETLRGSITAIDKGQFEAGLSIGLSFFQTLRRIVLPQALMNAIPALGNSFVEIIKGSAMAFTIGVTELMGAAQLEGASNYKYLETFTAVMIAYFIITSFFSRIQIIIENYISRKYNS